MAKDLASELARPDRVLVPVSALAAARELDDSSGQRRGRGAPVRKSFVRTDTATPAPLSVLARVGGRGGVVAIKLYLALLWRCSSPPYRTAKPARAWATLLGLEDPAGKGTRRIAAAIKALQAANLITVEYQPGVGNDITILDESGNGQPYALASTQYVRAAQGPSGDVQRSQNRYFKIPAQWWTEGKIQGLSGPGLIMLLILLAERAGDGEDVWFSTEAFPARYRISAKTRAAGTKELEGRMMLDVGRQALSDIPGSVFARQRFRNIYRLINFPALDEPVIPPAPDEAAPQPPQPVFNIPRLPRGFRVASQTGQPTPPS